jgi:hypothetical protein
MTQSASLIPMLFFAALIGTVVTAPIYYMTANKLGGAGQITLTLVVAVVLGGAILAAAVTRTPDESAATTIVILTPLATGWIISALVSLLIWTYDRRAASPPESASDQLPKFQEKDLPGANAQGGEPSSRRGAALDHQTSPLIATLQPAEPPSLPSRAARQVQAAD